jgi:hypothetical protein
MLFNMLWCVSAVVPMVLLRLLLEPLTGEPSAAFLAAGVIISSNLLWTEHCRVQAWFETDRLRDAAVVTYSAVLSPLLPTITQLLVNTRTAAPAWQHLIAYPVVYLILSVPLVTIALLLCRFSFSAAEMRDMGRHLSGATQQPAPVRRAD